MAQGSIKRALVSVTDKTGVVEFVKTLEDEFGVEVISTGGTARVLADAGVNVVPIEQYTGFPEMMDGRVKTLHPKVHGGLLCRRDSEQHMAEAAEHNIELIDIGGPSMLRSAAKNADAVTVVSDPADYDAVLAEMRANDGATTLETRRRLQLKVYQTTAAYDTAIAAWLGEQAAKASAEGEATSAFPEKFVLTATKEQDLRYGENPQQAAAFYVSPDAPEHSLARAEQIQGKPLSYNNILDADAAWAAVREFDEPAVVILKHQNPCGSATAADVTEAYDRAFACDPISAYGGIIAVNREVPLSLCEHFADVNKQFVEVMIAPSYTPEALERLSKRKNMRVLATGGVDRTIGHEVRTVDGGVLVQDIDHVSEDPATFTVPTKRKPTDAEMDDLLFAWRVCKAVKSNAILVAKGRAGIGMGPGQPNRTDSARIACERAEAACERMGVSTEGMVAASDAFLPFRDDVDVLAEHGITAIIQPGGSIRDEESIQACDEHGIAMVFTGTRHFRH